MNKSTQGLWKRNKLNLNVLQEESSLTPGEMPQVPVKKPLESTVDESPIPAKRKPRSMREDVPTKRTKLSASKDHSPPLIRLSDLGGIDVCIERILELVAMPLCHPEIYLHTGVQPPRGVLLHGPPGCGKTMLANAIAGELGMPFLSISAPSIVSGMSGESEKTLRDTFDEAKRAAPCLLFIDEIDAITPKRESAQREMERRIVAQFLTCMDDISWENNDNKPVVVIGATNRPDSLDAALRRAGRFDHEIAIGVPDEEARTQILRVQSSKLRLEGDFDFTALAKATPGYVGADLASLTGAAGIVAVKRIFRELSSGSVVLPEIAADTFDSESTTPMSIDIFPGSVPNPVESLPFSSYQGPSTPLASSIVHFLRAHPNPLTGAQLSPLNIQYSDFTQALKHVQPSSKREGFATIPDVNWADIGALYHIREELQMAIVQPIRRPELFEAVGIDTGCGVLLWGPPGCGKTLLAKAVANESRANFISVKGPELLNKYVGESERAVRQVFSRARASVPCIIFFDELDALVPKRDDSVSESAARVVNTLLTELDGLDSRKNVYVVAATNRPDMIDPAMCRPGRLDKLLYVDLPTADERAEIIRTVIRKARLAPGSRVAEEVDLLVREKCDGYSGADLAAIAREAGVCALKRILGSPGEDTTEARIVIHIDTGDFVQALEKIGPSVSATQRGKYLRLKNKFAGLPIGKTQTDAD